MIDACSILRGYALAASRPDKRMPLLYCADGWMPAAGSGTVIGLLDTGFDPQVADLCGADLRARDFTGSSRGDMTSPEHGTHSVALLLGQGREEIRGIVPRARLLVAIVVPEDGAARPEFVADAIDWLTGSGARILVAPLGGTEDDSEISREVERSADSGCVFFAAAGNTHPEPLLFPARHPLAIAVGASDFDGNILQDCAREPRLDLIAPAWKIAAPVRRGFVCRRSGSSVACVVAAAVAALAISAGAVLTNSVSRTNVLDAVTARVHLGAGQHEVTQTT